MREIKFRTWGIFSGKEQMQNVMPVNPLPNGQWEVWWRGSIFTMNNLMQYTGLKDKNGVEIYEGDVQEYEETDFDTGAKYPERFTVSFQKGVFACDPDGEVIGNVYEHPELIK